MRELIDDVGQEQRREQLAHTLGAWSLTVRQFRRVELARMIATDSTEADRELHFQCLQALIAIGDSLIALASALGHDQLRPLGISHEDLSATVASLRLTLRESHAPGSQVEIASIQRKVFGQA